MVSPGAEGPFGAPRGGRLEVAEDVAHLLGGTQARVDVHGGGVHGLRAAGLAHELAHAAAQLVDDLGLGEAARLGAAGHAAGACAAVIHKERVEEAAVASALEKLGLHDRHPREALAESPVKRGPLLVQDAKTLRLPAHVRAPA